MLHNIILRAQANNVSFQCVWLPRGREEFRFADLTTRNSTVEFSLVKKTQKSAKNLVFQFFGATPTLDVFRRAVHHVCDNYFTRYPYDESSGAPGEVSP